MMWKSTQYVDSYNGSVMMASMSLSLGAAATPLKLTVTLWFGWNERWP